MTYRGVEYAIKFGVGRGEWVIAISFPENPAGATLLKIRGGTREQAAVAARRSIRSWMKRQVRKTRSKN